MITIYGIGNCDIVKKTLKWFESNSIAIYFHDYKKQGITEKHLAKWCNQSGWKTIFNKRSTTWRELPGEIQEKVTSQAEAIKLMFVYTSIIKRPVIEFEKNIIVGFNEKIYHQKFKK